YVGFYTLLTNGGFLAFAGKITAAKDAPVPAINASNFFRMAATFYELSFQSMPLLMGAAILGGIVAVRRRTVEDRVLLVAAVASTLIFCLTYSYLRNYYLLHSVPLYSLLAAGAFAELEARIVLSPDKVSSSLAVGLILLVLGGVLGKTV